MTNHRYLQAYDLQLRTEAETPSAIASERLGPLRLVRFTGGRGFITYPHFDEADSETVRGLVRKAADHYRHDPSISRVEWKTRGHDRIEGLDQALRAEGFVPDDVEAIMVGPVEGLVGGEPPAGVTVRRVETESNVRAMSAMIDEAFGEDVDISIADALVARLARGDGMELWVAEVDGRMVSGGRLEPVPGTDFVAIWGGATLPAYRGRGIYRAVTSARARSALAMGKTLVHSDSSADSQPILRRCGLVQVSTTTPYMWRRPAP